MASKRSFNRTSSSSKRASSADGRCSGIPRPRTSSLRGGVTPLQTPVVRRPSTASKRSTHSQLVTPQQRSACKSPNSIKQYYAKPDERTSLARVRKYLLDHEQKFEISKPTTINDFIGVTQFLLSFLYGHTVEVLTQKNYKTEMPSRLKLLEYPITISQSFLKAPNTPQNFQSILSIWIYLLDLIEATSPLDCINEDTKLYIEYVYKQDAISLEELEHAFYESRGLKKEEVHDHCQELKREEEQLCQEGDELVNECIANENQLKMLRDKQNAKTAEIEATRKQEHEISQAIAKMQIEIKINVKRCEDSQRNERDSLDRLTYMKQQLQEFKCTIAECEELESDLQKYRRRLELLRERNEIFNARSRSEKERLDAIIVEAEILVYRHNTKINLQAWPECIRETLLMNEQNIHPEQVQDVRDHLIRYSEQSAADYKESQQRLNEYHIQLTELDQKLNEKQCALDEQRQQKQEIVQEKQVARNEELLMMESWKDEQNQLNEMKNMLEEMQNKLADVHDKYVKLEIKLRGQLKANKAVYDDVVGSIKESIEYVVDKKNIAINKKLEEMEITRKLFEELRKKEDDENSNTKG